MGVQSAINSALGTMAAAAVAGKKMGEAKEAKLEGAKENLSFSEAELAAAKATQAESSLALEGGQKSLDEAQSKYDTAMAKRPGGKGNTKQAIAEQQAQALDDLEAAKKAFDVLEKKDIAAKAMTARWQERRDNAHAKLQKLGGIK